MADTLAPVRPSRPAAPARPVVVLHSLAAPDGTTRYVDQMLAGASDELTALTFSWRTALLGRYDVLHLHWPELLLRGRTRVARTRKRVALRLLLARLAATGTPLVRTLHNVAPHEAGDRGETRLLAALERRTALRIRLNPTTPVPPGAAAVTIAHGHYRDRFAGHERAAAVPGRLLYFGLIRPYKGVDRLLDLAPTIAATGCSLRLVGSPAEGMRPAIEAALEREPALSAELAFVPDDRLVAEVTAAELVVLPYRELHNSGAVLVALSLGVPVLVPETPSTSALAEEVGPGWVTRYEGELTAADVDAALAAPRDAPPRLDGRDWPEVGRRHLEAYRSVLGRPARP